MQAYLLHGVRVEVRGQFVESVFSLPLYVGSGDGTQVVHVVWQCHLLSHLTHPKLKWFCCCFFLQPHLCVFVGWGCVHMNVGAPGGQGCQIFLEFTRAGATGQEVVSPLIGAGFKATTAGLHPCMLKQRGQVTAMGLPLRELSEKVFYTCPCSQSSFTCSSC